MRSVSDIDEPVQAGEHIAGGTASGVGSGATEGSEGQLSWMRRDPGAGCPLGVKP